MNKTEFYRQLEKLNDGDEITNISPEEMLKYLDACNYNSCVITRNNEDDTVTIQVTEYHNY